MSKAMKLQSAFTKYVVQPIVAGRRGRFEPGQMREARDEADALRILEGLADRFPGVAAYAVDVDPAADLYGEPRIIKLAGVAREMEAS